MDPYRSTAEIRTADLERLLKIALMDQANFFQRNHDIARVYRDRLACVALCQGAALHYVDGSSGIKDFDVWSFYVQSAERAFPQRRPRTIWDFRDPRFGTSPDAPAHFSGKRVDVFVKGIAQNDMSDHVANVTIYLQHSRTRTARCLARKLHHTDAVCDVSISDAPSGPVEQRRRDLGVFTSSPELLVSQNAAGNDASFGRHRRNV